MSHTELESTIANIAVRGKGILAADESVPTITKRFGAIDTESTEESRRAYRELLLSTPGLSDHIAGVILFEETLNQLASDGTPLPEVLSRQGILPGIKVDKGLVALPGTDDEKVTQGLDGLAERLDAYKEKGAKFTKWRAVFSITDIKPSCLAMEANATGLARYAAICQAKGLVPIVEPEVLIDGDHTIERCAKVTEEVLRCVFSALSRHKVVLEHIILKPSMVISGKGASTKASPEQVAQMTIKVLRRTVPAAVPTINFLSGGQTPEEATEHLNLVNKMESQPWNLSLSYGRALQEPCLKTWHGKTDNVQTAQAALHHRAKLNGAACLGEYSKSMEEEAPSTLSA